MIDKATIQRVMDATDIVEVVREFVDLRKAGVNYKGLCPFHNEKTPSFTVSPSKQLCKCFSCGKGGNAVHFLMELEQMTYPEAIKWLGRKYGIEVKEKELTDRDRELQSEREIMFVVNEWAAKYFQDILHDHVDGVAKGMAYFRSRGFRDDTIRKFQLGYSLEERDAMTKAALAHGFKAEFLTKTGISYKTDDGKLLDRYHGRVIFPVHTLSGKVVAFGGRILSSDKKLAKYVNSPESIIYSKSHELYGLYQAKSAIVRQKRCFLVEGYTDVISMHQSGIENVVASSGTSLTEGQIRLLHRFTQDITILYDGDAAGIKASLRGIDMLLAEGLNIKVLLLPDGHDPDSFARSHKAEEFQRYIDSHQVDFIKFKTNLLLDESQGDPIQRAALITDVVKSISVIPDQIVRQMYVRECAGMLQVSEELIMAEIAKQHRQAVKNQRTKEEHKDGEEAPTSEEPPVAERATSSLCGSAEERMIMAMVIRYGECAMQSLDQAETGADDAAQHTMPLVAFVKQSLEDDGLQLSTPLFQKMLNEACEQAAAQPEWKALPYFTRHPDAQTNALASELAEDSFVLSSGQRKLYTDDKYRLEEMMPRLLNDFKHSIVKQQVAELLRKMQDPGLMDDPTKAKEIMSRYMELCAIERQFAQILGDRVVMV